MKRLILILGLAFLSMNSKFSIAKDVFEFDVLTATTGAGGTASGTSNGIGWSIGPTFILGPQTVTDNTYTGYDDPDYFDPPIAMTDSIHIGGESFTIEFEEDISALLVYLENDTGSLLLDFGIQPIVVSGEITIVGTGFGTNLSGGIVLLDDINSATLTHTPNVFDGMNIAFFANPPTAVPEPSASWLLLGIVGVAFMTRRHRQEAASTLRLTFPKHAEKIESSFNN